MESYRMDIVDLQKGTFIDTGMRIDKNGKFYKIKTKMTEEQFDQIVESRLKSIKQTLIEKGKEYRRNEDPLHNFNRASEISGQSREKVLWGFALKHYVSFLDMLDDMEQDFIPSEDKVNEKIGDLINYLILAEASIKDRIYEADKQIRTEFS